MPKPRTQCRRRCDSCGSEDLRVVQNLDVFSQEIFAVVWCTRCEFGRTDFPSDKSLQSYYPPSYYGKQDHRFIGLAESLVRWSRWQRAKFVEKWATRCAKRILDHGCGRGLMLAFLQKRGWASLGTEYSQESSHYARSLGLDIVIPRDGEDPLALVQGTFGVITAWHALEHSRQPALVLQHFWALLEPGGFLFLEVPNFSSFQATLDRGHWIYTECPRHLSHFSPKSLTSFLSSSGFAITAMSTFSWEYGVFGLLQSFLNVVCPQKNLLFYFMRNTTGKPQRFPTTPSAVLSFLMTAVLLVPLLLISAVMETVLSFMNRGGVITVVSQKYLSSTDQVRLNVQSVL